MLHPDYVVPASVSASPSTQRVVESWDEDEELKDVMERILNEAIENQKKELKELIETKFKPILEAEWDTEHINDLPDSAFAVIDRSMASG